MITTEQMSETDMRETAKTHRCGQCNGQLTVAWGGAFGINGYILRCGRDIAHNTITRHDKETEKQIQQIKEARHLDSTSLMNMNETAMLERVNLAKFPEELKPAEKKLLAAAAVTYGFDPLMGELLIYQGRPYVSIDGRYRKAQESGKLDGIETRPANKEERTTWRVPEEDYFFRSNIYVKGCSRPFTGWGRVRAAETVGKGYKPVETNPQRMAEKRAEAQALRKAFSIPLPSAEDIGAPEDERANVKVVSVDNPPVKVIEATGEIVEPDTRSEADKDWEAMKSDSSRHKTNAEPKTSPAESTVTVGTESPVDLDWLRDQLIILKKLKGWSHTAVVAKVNAMTGKQAGSVSEAVQFLTKEQAQQFMKEVQEAVELA